MPALERCAWPGEDPLYVRYHDTEWGVPERDSRALFEKLLLDGFQAGLSWITILRKRDAFRKAFDNFVPQKIARYSAAKVQRLMNDAGIVRNRAKIEGAILSAKAYLQLEREGSDFAEWLWAFVGGQTIRHKRRAGTPPPVDSDESHAMAKALKARGFKFCGPTICYAFMQAVGMVDDHVVTCFRHGKAR
jgi:DNA-3-methyladenine glycosylase I